MTGSQTCRFRTARRRVAGRPTVDGAGVKLVRVLGSPTVRDFDPFLMLDAFDSREPADYIRGFPMHPHRGIETVTYLAEGRIEHRDSLGNKGSIVGGGCQWMTAGRGILHEEMLQPSPRMLGLQLWINLPRGDKMCPPKYNDITPEMLPRVEENGVRVGVLAGTYKGTAGAIRTEYTPVTFLDVELAAGGAWTLETDPLDTAFVYLLAGGCSTEAGDALEARQVVLLTEGERLTLVGGKEDTRLVFVAGRPLREPVAWGGPIVMNTAEELTQAFFELEAGKFIR